MINFQTKIYEIFAKKDMFNNSSFFYHLRPWISFLLNWRFIIFSFLEYVVQRWPCHSLTDWLPQWLLILEAKINHWLLETCDPRDLWPVRRNDLANKKTKTLRKYPHLQMIWHQDNRKHLNPSLKRLACKKCKTHIWHPLPMFYFQEQILLFDYYFNNFDW